MKKKDIINQASIYTAQADSDDYANVDDVRHAFIAGSEWRINSVWHEGSEKPDTDKGDLLVIVKDAFGKYVYVHQNAYYVLKYGCVRWAYIKDLIPTED